MSKILLNEKRNWQYGIETLGSSAERTELAAVLAAEYHIPQVLADILTARGYDSPATAGDWLETTIKLSDPFTLPDMPAAVERIRALH